MTSRKGDQRESRKKPQSLVASRALQGREAWYLQRLHAFIDAKGRTPSVSELATRCRRSRTPVYWMMLRLESLGFVERDDQRRFRPRDGAP